MFHNEPFWPHYYFYAIQNGLPDQVKSKIRLCADDVLLYATIISHAECFICITTGFRLASELGRGLANTI